MCKDRITLYLSCGHVSRKHVPCPVKPHPSNLYVSFGPVEEIFAVQWRLEYVCLTCRSERIEQTRFRSRQESNKRYQVRFTCSSANAHRSRLHSRPCLLNLLPLSSVDPPSTATLCTDPLASKRTTNMALLLRGSPLSTCRLTGKLTMIGQTKRWRHKRTVNPSIGIRLAQTKE